MAINRENLQRDSGYGRRRPYCCVAIERKRRRRKADSEVGISEVVLPILEWLAEQGINALIRVDPERLAESQPAWTFAASGGPLSTGLRADGRSADECLSEAMVSLREAGVVVPY